MITMLLLCNLVPDICPDEVCLLLRSHCHNLFFLHSHQGVVGSLGGAARRRRGRPIVPTRLHQTRVDGGVGVVDRGVERRVLDGGSVRVDGRVHAAQWFTFEFGGFLSKKKILVSPTH